MGAARSLGQPGQAHVARLASVPVETSTQGMLPARYRYLLYLCLAAVNTALVLVVSGSPACLPGPCAFIYGTTHRPSIAPSTASHTHQLRVGLFLRLH